MIDDRPTHLALLHFRLFIPEAQSLKDKRAALKGLKERIRQGFNVSVVETGSHDKWQVATISIAMIGDDRPLIDSCFAKIRALIEGCPFVEICEQETEYL